MVETQIRKRSYLAAWGVHAFTMTGIIWACLAIIALVKEDIVMMWLWLGIALVVDAVDGTMARKADVKNRVPWFDGTVLDIVVDYLTWTFIPALFMYLHIPLGGQWLATLMLVVMTASSLFCYCNTNLKTDDYFFMGFPAAWNVVAVVMWLFHTGEVFGPAFNIFWILLLSILTVAPITFVHPLRVTALRKFNALAAGLWILATVYLVIEHPNLPIVGTAVWVISGLWIIGISAARTIKGKLDG